MSPPEDLQVPRVREDDFHSRILPYRKRTSLELSEAIRALYAVRGKHLENLYVFGEDLQGFLLAPEYLPLARGHLRTGASPAGKAPKRGTTRFWMRPTSPSAEGERLRN
jgi:hypothetical protein